MRARMLFTAMALSVLQSCASDPTAGETGAAPRIRTIRTDSGDGSCNCFLIDAGDGFILIDTGGCTPLKPQKAPSRAKLERGLAEAGCLPGKLKLIVISHGHSDHIGNAAYLRDKYGAKIAMHPADPASLETPEAPEESGASFLAKAFMILYGANTRKMIAEFESFSPDIPLDEGFDLSPYGWDARVQHLPGHSKGSIGILTSDGDLFCGDVLVNMFGPGIMKATADDLGIWESSLARLRALRIGTVYTAHGKSFPMEAYARKGR